MRARLHTWMVATRDTSLLPEVDMCRRAKGGSPYTMAWGESPFHPARVLNTAWLVGRGPKHLATLRTDLADRDNAVRYWAAVGLTALGAEARPAAGALRKALEDSSPCVRIAAADALLSLAAKSGKVKNLPLP